MDSEQPANPPGAATLPAPLDRREALGLLGATAALIFGADVPLSAQAAGRTQMTLTCFIRYQIDPYQREAFKEYAQNWGRIIPRCGGHLLGYFLPSEGTNDVGWGLIAFESLAAYEAYRRRIAADPDGRGNFAMAQARRFILREERTFVEVVDGTFGIAAVPPK